MLSEKPFTTNIMNDILNKPLYFFDDDQLNVSNSIHPDDLGFFEEYYGEYQRKVLIMRDADETLHWLETVDSIDWLNAHHFDFRGLIEKGLALEAPKGMYEKK